MKKPKAVKARIRCHEVLLRVAQREQDGEWIAKHQAVIAALKQHRPQLETR